MSCLGSLLKPEERNEKTHRPDVLDVDVDLVLQKKTISAILRTFSVLISSICSKLETKRAVSHVEGGGHVGEQQVHLLHAQLLQRVADAGLRASGVEVRRPELQLAQLIDLVQDKRE